jgi:hypothetical protein
MKPITLPPSPPGSDPAAQFAWIRACLQTIERASQEEPAQIFDSYSSDTGRRSASRFPSPHSRSEWCGGVRGGGGRRIEAAGRLAPR